MVRYGTTIGLYCESYLVGLGLVKVNSILFSYLQTKTNLNTLNTLNTH